MAPVQDTGHFEDRRRQARPHGSAPRTPEGKPDLSGFWQTAPNPYLLNIIQDHKDEAIFKPAAEAIFQERVSGFARDWPSSRCLPLGPEEMIFPDWHRIVRPPTVVALLYNGGTGDGYRQIFLDGRELPKNPNPSLVNGRLYFGPLPLVPQSETRFESFSGGLEFHSMPPAR